MQLGILILFSLVATSAGAQKKVADFEGDYLYRHSLHMTAENETVHGVEDIVKIQALNEREAQVLVETYTHNFHSCQLIGKAQLEGQKLIFKSSINRALNRGRATQCRLEISLVGENGSPTKTLKLEDIDDACKLKFCGMQAQLSGEFPVKNSVEVKDKN
ncbi:MAG: hypothetical protein ACK5Y2_11770 [Bdellovibrionales bacterium]